MLEPDEDHLVSRPAAFSADTTLRVNRHSSPTTPAAPVRRGSSAESGARTQTIGSVQ